MINVIEKHKPGKPYSDELRGKVITLRRDGFSYGSIRKQTGVSIQTVAKYCSDAGLGGYIGYRQIQNNHPIANTMFGN